MGYTSLSRTIRKEHSLLFNDKSVFILVQSDP